MGIKKQTEKRFMRAVMRFAELHGWRAYHTRDSRGSDEGFPDLVMVKGGRIVFAELKLTGGKPSEAQTLWLADLATAAGGSAGAVEVHVWTPANWQDIERVLGGK